MHLLVSRMPCSRSYMQCLVSIWLASNGSDSYVPQVPLSSLVSWIQMPCFSKGEVCLRLARMPLFWIEIDAAYSPKNLPL